MIWSQINSYAPLGHRPNGGAGRVGLALREVLEERRAAPVEERHLGCLLEFVQLPGSLFKQAYLPRLSNFCRSFQNSSDFTRYF